MQDKVASELNYTLLMIIANEVSPIVTCTDSCAVYWGQVLCQELLELSHHEQVTLGHVTGHAPLTSPGNDEVDPLARVWRLEWAPPTNLVAWLPHCLQHADVKIMRNVVKQWGLHLT